MGIFVKWIVFGPITLFNVSITVISMLKTIYVNGDPVPEIWAHEYGVQWWPKLYSSTIVKTEHY